jgi:hypothetical protein
MGRCGDAHAVRVLRERLEIVEIRREYGSVRLCESDDERVYGGTSMSLPAQPRRAPPQRFGNLLHDIAGL